MGLGQVLRCYQIAQSRRADHTLGLPRKLLDELPVLELLLLELPELATELAELAEEEEALEAADDEAEELEDEFGQPQIFKRI
jgi:hypothetical protein